MKHRKRTTAPDGIRGVMGPPTKRPVKAEIPPGRRISPGKAARVAVELARERRRVRHRPTVAQVRAMARFGGRQPCSYRLDRAVNWLPESLPLDFPHGASGLCFAHPGGEVVRAAERLRVRARLSASTSRPGAPPPFEAWASGPFCTCDAGRDAAYQGDVRRVTGGTTAC